MAHTKAKGTSKLGRDSNAQRLGVKVYAGHKINNGCIIVRQRGSKYHAGLNTAITKDDSIVAKKEGIVAFKTKIVQAFTGTAKKRKFVEVR